MDQDEDKDYSDQELAISFLNELRQSFDQVSHPMEGLPADEQAIFEYLSQKSKTTLQTIVEEAFRLHAGGAIPENDPALVQQVIKLQTSKDYNEAFDDAAIQMTEDNKELIQQMLLNRRPPGLN